MNTFSYIRYAALYLLVKMLALLPMCVLYLLADVLYLLIYRVVRYRVKLVRRNLYASFPEKDEKERRMIEHGFYKHFADYVVETLKLAHISLAELQKRAYVENPGLIDKLMDEGHPCCILLMGHFGNWEWYSGSTSRFKDARIYQIYRPLKVQAVDKLFIRLRSKFGAYVLSKNDTGRKLMHLKRDEVRSVVIFLADQTPSRRNLHYWTQFLSQDTPILTGAERLARKLDMPVVFLDVKMLRRGYYTLEFQLLTDKPKDTPENWLTEEYARRMEKSILRHPEGWLWTHNRWKYKRQDAMTQHGKETQ